MSSAEPLRSVATIDRNDRERSGPCRSGPAGRPGAAFALLAAVQVALILAITVITVPLPAIQRDFDLTRGELALLGAAYGLSFSGLLLLGGRLADITGRRRVLRVGAGLFGLASVAAGLAPVFPALLAARFLQGIGAALAAPSALALLSDVFPDVDRRTRVVAAWGSLSAVGAVSGVLLSGVAATWVPWRWIIAFPAWVAALAAFTVPRLLPSPPPVRGRLDVLGALLATGGLTALSYGLVTTLDQPWSAPGVVGPLAGGVGLLGAFIVAEARAPAPLLPLSFFTSVPRIVALAAILVASGGISTSLFVLSLYFQQVHGRSPLQTSTLLLPYGLVAIAGPVAGRLIPRVGAPMVTVAGLLVAASGLLLLSRMDVAAAYRAPTLVGLLLLPVGIGLTFAGATVGALVGILDHQAGVAGGIVNTALEAGPTIGLAALLSLAGVQTAHLSERGLTSAAATTGGYAFALIAAAVAFTLTAVATVAVHRAARHASRARCSDPIG